MTPTPPASPVEIPVAQEWLTPEESDRVRTQVEKDNGELLCLQLRSSLLARLGLDGSPVLPQDR